MSYLCSLLGVLCFVLYITLKAVLSLCIAWGYVLTSLICMQLSSFSAPLAEEIVFSPFYILASFLKINWPEVCEFISELFILFHWSMYLFVCVCVCVRAPIPHCFDYYDLIILCEVWENYATCFVLFPHDCFGNFKCFMVPCKF